MRAIVITLSLLLGGAVDAQQDTQAIIVNGEFVCDVDTIDISLDPTVAPVRSVQLYRADALGFPAVCSNMLGALNELTFHTSISFLIPYETDLAGLSVKPQMRARGFSELNCIGEVSVGSANACIVTHGLPAPVMAPAAGVPPVEPPLAGEPSTTLLPGTIGTTGPTLVRVVVDPNGTALAALLLHFTAQDPGLQILSVTPTDPQVISSGPALSGFPRSWHSGFAGTFGEDRLIAFEVGTLSLQGVTPGAALLLDGNYTDGEFIDIVIAPTTAALVEEFTGTAIAPSTAVSVE